MKSSQQSDDTPAPSSREMAVSLVKTMGDTTWRMFVPTIGLTILGLVIDDHQSTKPWMTIAGIIVGTIITVLLVRRQLAALQKK
ncbi:MAG TPA: AtpZ/AtpI family protein [Candidatus Saccharibacteria bacterium]|nr:AtpZ/AtpI family protein [Candidatus Saccharibacteria bacterium]